jgi:hypothetical protein
MGGGAQRLLDVTAVLVSSAVISAGVAGLTSFLTQRWLLERKAQIDYEFIARKRLYEAIGPLRLQFLFAARDVVRRVANHPGTRWNMDPTEYYAKSFIYRLLRPLAIGQLIERQMSIADFSVDIASLELLRFKAAMEETLTGGGIVLEHPKTNWSTQTQHLFGDNLRVAAARLVVTNPDGTDEVMDYAGFKNAFPDPASEPALKDLVLIFARCDASLLENPIFWLRAVGYASVCESLTAAQGEGLGLQKNFFDATELLDAVPDEYISSRLPEYVNTFDTITREGL